MDAVQLLLMIMRNDWLSHKPSAADLSRKQLVTWSVVSYMKENYSQVVISGQCTLTRNNRHLKFHMYHVQTFKSMGCHGVDYTEGLNVNTSKSQRKHFFQMNQLTIDPTSQHRNQGTWPLWQHSYRISSSSRSRKPDRRVWSTLL